MDTYYDAISEVAMKVLIQARCGRSLDEDNFNKLYMILQELEKEVSGKDMIPRNIAGLLFFIYCSLNDNLKYSNYKDVEFIALANMEEILDKILWDSPFKHDYR